MRVIPLPAWVLLVQWMVIQVWYGVSTYGAGGGGVRCYDESDPIIVNCTFYHNSGTYGGGVYCTDGSFPVLENSIVAFSTQGVGVYCGGGSLALLSCCDVFGNSGGDWVECIEDQFDINGNFSADPLLCDPDGQDYRIAEESPCAAENNERCGTIGAYGTGCVPSRINAPGSFRASPFSRGVSHRAGW